jgi:hypothetical protein
VGTSRSTQLVLAAVAVASGLLVGFLIYVHPEGLRAPAWVAYVAAFAFVLAGLSLLAGAIGAIALQHWLGVAITASLFAVALWVAFGPGERECSMSLSFVESIAPDAVCRSFFGVGAILVGLFLVLVLRRSFGRRPEA